MSNNQELEEVQLVYREPDYCPHGHDKQIIQCHKCDGTAIYTEQDLKDQQLALINKIEELESMQDELTTTQEEGWLVNRKLDRNRLRSGLREALNKLKQEIE